MKIILFIYFERGIYTYIFESERVDVIYLFLFFLETKQHKMKQRVNQAYQPQQHF